LNMLRTTHSLAHKDDNGTIWSGNVPFSDGITELGHWITKAEEAAGIQALPTEGITTDKSEAKAAMAEAVEDLAGIVFAWAYKNDNDNIMSQAKISDSDITQADDTQAKIIADNILELATEHATAISNYGVDVTPLTAALQPLITAYDGKIEDPREAVIRRANATQNLKDAIIKGKEVVRNQLLKLIVLFKAANPDFVNQFKMATEIIDLGGGSSDTDTQTGILAISVENAATSEALANVLCKILGTNIEDVTLSNGTLIMENVPIGNQTLEVTLNGFNTFTTSISVTATAPAIIHVELTPAAS